MVLRVAHSTCMTKTLYSWIMSEILNESLFTATTPPGWQWSYTERLSRPKGASSNKPELSQHNSSQCVSVLGEAAMLGHGTRSAHELFLTKPAEENTW